MSRKCMFTGKRPQIANKISHSNIKTKRRQLPNVHTRRFFWVEGGRFVTLKVSTSAMRTIDKLGLETYAAQVGVDLSQF